MPMVTEWSSRDIVAALYAGILNRVAEPEDVAGWVNELETQQVPLDQVVRRFADSDERVQLEERRPLALPTPWLGGPPLTIVDVGAQPLEFEDDVYRPLLDGGGCEVVGFEPLEDGQKARLARDGGWRLLTDFVGDGSRRTFYETAWGPQSSLYEPDLDTMGDFDGMAEVSVAGTRQVDTVRLDDVIDGAVDLLKLDVQGGELDVLRGASRVLGDVLAVHVEVEFIPIYRSQPLFDDVFRSMVAAGFELFDLPRLERCRYLGSRGRADRLVWAEAVFIPSRVRLDRLDAERTLRLARIMRDAYGALDFCEWLLARLDRRLGSSYLNQLPGPGGRPVPA
jgi:FkbM family methyltransferase